MLLLIGCPCVSWPRMYDSCTLVQSTCWSSVTLTSTWTVSPKWNGWPATGLTNSIVGRALPTMIWTSADAERPVRSVTFSVAL